MANINSNRSILDEQELILLTSPASKKNKVKFTVYTYKVHLNDERFHVYFTNTFEQLILLLSASPRASALVLPDNITTHPLINKLITLLTTRQDIQIFWLGEMPSMEFELAVFIYCKNIEQLHNELLRWFQRVEYWFKQWLKTYHAALISDNKNNELAELLTSTGLCQLVVYDGKQIENDITNDQLLIIDLTTSALLFVTILKNLALNDKFPTLILFGDLSANQCRAAAHLAANFGFTTLASLPSTPNKQEWEQLLLLLFGEVYVKHWINEEPMKIAAYGIYNLEDHHLESYFCTQEMQRKQIACLPNNNNVRRIIYALSLDKWFPDGIKKNSGKLLAKYLNCGESQIDLFIDTPENIPTTSPIFAVLLMARLSHYKIYWFVKNESQLSIDVLKNYPISDLILSESISHNLLSTPSDELLNFIEQAKQQEIRLGASLQQNKATTAAMSLYGIEFVLNKQISVE